MNKSTMRLILGSLLSVGGTALAISGYKTRQKQSFSVLADTDMRNTVKLDHKESVDAEKDPAERGLTQYDSTLRSEWVANGFPQTNEDIPVSEKKPEIESVSVRT
ncbi:hypothetical protein CUU64_11105 [Bacillus sp. V5-8f]|nr:hypothetical protein CUU64_11105 [Bacillus sp. V5-8f]